MGKICQYRDEITGIKCKRKAVTEYLDGKVYCNSHLQDVRDLREERHLNWK